DELGGVSASTTLSACRGEALISRAYNHFMLANMFCWRYDKAAANHLGLPYMEKPETSLNPQYERGNLKEFYEKIQADIEEGLPLVSDDLYQVPKYHFNVKAAWALAARFYLYTEQWEKAIEAATNVVGPSPKVMLRDYKAMSEMAQNITAITNEYINPSSNANLLLHTNFSILGMIFGNYSTYGRYSHGGYVAENEDISATNICGGSSMFWQGVKIYRATNGVRNVFWKMPNLFEYTDINAGTGYRHSVVVAFSTDEALLNRAEAYIMLGRYTEAAADLTTFMQNITKSTMVLTPDNITEFYNKQSDCYADENKMLSGLKKHLNPSFTIDAEGSV
ncbi:MAG: RagB/SusD family nutrient uptake outer membrane protein, partial [Muribaculaceae bacterium]|nr:RagB/SusD family nutrient uptake outer membrane protein [Muribaculaceae bacterium]